MHPDQFAVNEAWIAFKLNDEPILTEADGNFDFIALMDAASCYIVSSTPVSATLAQPTEMEAKQLLAKGQARKNELPTTLFIPTDQPAQFLELEAQRQGIKVVRIAEEQLLVFIGDAREGFRERFGSAGVQ